MMFSDYSASSKLDQFSIEKFQSGVLIAIECSSSYGSIAVGTKGQPPLVFRSTELRKHSETLNLGLSEILEKIGRENRNSRQNSIKSSSQFALQNMISGVVVGSGPGSFTGIRVALAIGKSISMSLGVGIMSFSSAESLAHQVPNGTGAKVLTLQNAYKNLLYCGEFYQQKLVKLDVKTIQDVVARPDIFDYTVVGDGLATYANAWPADFIGKLKSLPEIQSPNAESLLEMAFATADSAKVQKCMDVQAHYIRESEADEKRAARLSTNSK